MKTELKKELKTERKSHYFTDAIGGHVALDLLNTVSIVDGGMSDSLQTDADVAKWLQEHSQALSLDIVKIKVPQLAETARQLRETIRELLTARREGKPVNPQRLNMFLQKGISHTQLVRLDTGKYGLKRIRQVTSAEELLAPVAEAAAELLATEDFNLVRKCESPDCVLWFYDRTKGHKRRWCSMAVCGNRHKVSKFRARQIAS
jgi:predicted RNA-binding Zn ribbon-like protein